MKRDISFTELMLIDKLLTAQVSIIETCKHHHTNYGEQPDMFITCLDAYVIIQKLLDKITAEEKYGE